MAGSTSEQIKSATFDHFEVLKETFLMMAMEPDATCRVDEGGLRLFVKVERLHSDLDLLAWPPLTICISGLLRTMPGGNKLAVTHRELAHNSCTVNSSVNHSYVFVTQGDELVESIHSVRACPELPEPPMPPVYDQAAYQADQGRAILQAWSAPRQEPTAGDCGVLFDRMMALIG